MEIQHFIVTITYLIPADQLGDVVTLHRQYLQHGFDRGWLLFSGPQAPRTGGIVVARAPSREALEDFFAMDPYQVNRLAEYQLTRFEPNKMQPFIENWVKGG